MQNVCMHKLHILLYIFSFILGSLPLNHGNLTVGKVLKVGEELKKETLPLQSGSTIYQLQGLKSHTWYEVKISYPASIPASFSIQLKRGNSDSGMNRLRKLLNTEKLIFKTDDEELINDQGGMLVLVSVEPEGVVAIPHVQERTHVIFNIVCDELLLGIPQKAWWVAICVLICLIFAFIIPSFLPSYLLPTDRSPQSGNQIASKDS